VRKIFIFGLTLFYIISICFSQDTITKKSGEDIQAKVLEVTLTEIKYKKFENQNGPTYSILKSNVQMIIYENRTKDIFNEGKQYESIPAPGPSTSDLYIQGQRDASKYYRGYKGAGTGTLITSLVSPLVGLIPAIACSAAQPKEINLNYPNVDLMKDPNYYDGYTQRSKKIKQGKIWTNWGIGLGVNLVAAIILSTLE